MTVGNPDQAPTAEGLRALGEFAVNMGRLENVLWLDQEDPDLTAPAPAPTAQPR